MSSANVLMSEIDLSTRVPSFPGVYCGIVIPAKKGPINDPQLVTSDTFFLRRYTPDEKIDVGMDLSHFSALISLQKTNKLWVVRAAINALNSGACIVSETADGDSVAFDSGIASPEAFLFKQEEDFDANLEVQEVATVACVDDILSSTNDKYFTFSSDTTNYYVWYNVGSAGTDPTVIGKTGVEVEIVEGDNAAAIATATAAAITALTGVTATSIAGGVIITVDDGKNVEDAEDNNTTFTLTVATQGTENLLTVSQVWETGDIVNLTTDGTLPAGLSAGTDYYVIYREDNEIQLAATAAQAILGDEIQITDVGSGIHTITPIGGNNFVADNCMVIVGANEGEWANDVHVKIINYRQHPDEVKEPNAFIIEVYKRNNLNDPVESHLCSRIADHKDGNNRNIYLEDVLQNSDFIRGYNNVAIAGTVLPKEVTTQIGVALDGGDDGDPVTDGAMMIAVETLRNEQNIPMTLLMDGGWATPAYHVKMIDVCEGRNDSFAIMSTPYSDEAASNYLEDIVDYRRNEANINSSFGAMYTSHVKVYDQYNDRSLYISPDGFVCAVIAETAANQEIWYPPAGWRRGVINVLDTRRRFNTGEMDYLYDNGINPIRFVPGRGVVVWGQKTLLSRPSALDRINVRLMLIVIEAAMKVALEDFLFEINDAATRAVITSVLSTYLTDIQARRGLYDFLVICDESNNTDQDIDNNRLNCWIFVKPTKSVEFIKGKVIITTTGADFSLAAQAI